MVANLAYTMTISRLVDPVAFGLMALAQLVVLFALFFVRMGLASALVQKPVLSRDDIRAASTAGIAIGVVCFGLIWVLAPLFGAFSGRPTCPPSCGCWASCSCSRAWRWWGSACCVESSAFGSCR